MVAIALLGVLIVMQRGSAADVIPLLGVLALGAQRLLPALQQMYSGWSSLKGCNAAIRSVLTMLDQSLPPLVKPQKPFLMRDGIRLEEVYFRYQTDQPEVLWGVNLRSVKANALGSLVPR